MDSKWHKSSYSNPSGSCVETREKDGKVQVRDTKDQNSPILVFGADEWMKFLGR